MTNILAGHWGQVHVLSFWNKKRDMTLSPCPAATLAIAALLCCSCSTPRATTQLVRNTHTDTIYLRNQQYDSIYIYQDRLLDRSKDTIYLRDISVEYRYRLLKDTIRMVERDSIPYEVTVTEVKEITRPLTWYDHTCRASFWLCIGGVMVKLLTLLKRLRRR